MAAGGGVALPGGIQGDCSGPTAPASHQPRASDGRKAQQSTSGWMERAAVGDGWPKSESVGVWTRPASARLVVTRRFLPEARGVWQDISAADERRRDWRSKGRCADYPCALELARIKYSSHEEVPTDLRFFGNAHAFRKNYLKQARHRAMS